MIRCTCSIPTNDVAFREHTTLIRSSAFLIGCDSRCSQSRCWYSHSCHQDFKACHCHMQAWHRHFQACEWSCQIFRLYCQHSHQCSQECHAHCEPCCQHSPMLPWLSSEVLYSRRFGASTPWYTQRPLDPPSHLLDMWTVWFVSNNSHTLVLAPGYKYTFWWCGLPNIIHSDSNDDWSPCWSDVNWGCSSWTADHCGKIYFPRYLRSMQGWWLVGGAFFIIIGKFT